MRIKTGKKDVYESWLNNNTDGYGRACFVYAERFADMLEIEYIKTVIVPMEEIIEKNAEKFSYDADIDGITGFMYGCAMNILAQCWEYGEILRKWHNKKYNAENTEGTVNPAVLIIK